MEKPLNDILEQELSEVQIEVKRIKAGSRYHYDLYTEFGTVILRAQTPITQEILTSLVAQNITHVYYDPARKEKMDADNVAELNTEKSIVSDEVQAEALAQAKELFDQIREILASKSDKSVGRSTVDSVRASVKRIIDEVEANQDAVFNPLASLQSMDEYEYQHAVNVSVLTSLSAARLEFSNEIRSAMGVGGLFHDIGKTSIAADILNKARILDEDFDEVKEHTHVGYKVVENNAYMHDIEKRSVLLHHERPDGNGYPFGFSMEHFAESQPREIRILSLCNVFVALVTKSPAEQPHSPHAALRKMLNLVQAPYKTLYYFLPGDFRDFVKASGFAINNGRFFLGPGDVIRLSTGEIALVESTNRLYPLKPRIRIITNSSLQPVKRQISIDMIQDLSLYIANIYDRSSGTASAQNKGS